VDDFGRRLQDLAIKASDRRRRAGPDIETDIGHAELNTAEALLIRCVHMDTVAPGANGFDAVVAFAKFELGAGERFARMCQPLEQGVAIRRDEPDHATHDFRRTHRQMELAHADIDPHIARAGIKERIAGEPEPGHVILRRHVLIVDADIDVTEIDDVADILRGAVVTFVMHGACFLRSRNIRRLAESAFAVPETPYRSRQRIRPSTYR
jgi:hypothetical protein